MLTVFQAGEDLLLLDTRRRLLESIGLAVVTASGARQALERIPQVHFDLAILCHSLPVHQRQQVAAALRRANPAAPVLLVGRGSAGLLGAEASEIDAIVDPHPARLTETLRRLLDLQHQQSRKVPGVKEMPGAAD
ncbi:MAG TPA: response regulator [Acidobacteriaceae bacterium]|nr:response regulator [Acidobacteriaceae bacterium]